MLIEQFYRIVQYDNDTLTNPSIMLPSQAKN